MNLELVIASLALIMSGAAIGVAIHSAKSAERSAAAAELSAELQRPGFGDGDVSFELVHIVGSRYRLINVGRATAEGVLIRETEVGGVGSRELPDGTQDLAPGAAVEFLLLGASGHPLRASVPVYWAGRDVPAHVPLPPSR